MKKLIVFIAIVFAMVSVFAQQSESEEKVLTLKECNALCQQKAATELQNKVGAAMTNPDPKVVANEIATAVMKYQQVLSVNILTKANDVAASLYFKKGQVNDMIAKFKTAMDEELGKIKADITTLQKDVKTQGETLGAVVIVTNQNTADIATMKPAVAKNAADIEKMTKELRQIYGYFDFGFMTGLNKGLAEMSLGAGIGIPFRYFTVEGGISGGIDLTSNNLTTAITAGMIFPLKDWGDKGEISFLFNGMFYSIIKLPEDNVNDKLLGMAYYGGGNIGVRHVLPVGEKKVGLFFQGELDAMYGEGRDRTATGWKRTLEPLVTVKLIFGVLF